MSVNHKLHEDALAFVTGTAMSALALSLLSELGLITGGIAGLAALLSYITGLSFGALFFLSNLPFYWLGYKRLGLRFMVKTLICVALVSYLIDWLPSQISYESLSPWVGSVLFGFLAGTALLVVFRHGASLGGIGILSFYIQDKTGFRAGWTQLIFDVLLFAAALFVLPLAQVLYSLLGAVVVNVVIALNHRKDRYVAI